MREIKFRAWIPRDKFMGVAFELKQRLNLALGGFADDTVFMQYTGLKDRNGKEIYEGDIVKWFEPLWVIQWGFASWEVVGQTFTYYFTPINHSEMEVIGNIYENPELLAYSQKAQ